eukprot:3040069-Amphidinium_carterae.1
MLGGAASSVRADNTLSAWKRGFALATHTASCCAPIQAAALGEEATSLALPWRHKSLHTIQLNDRAEKHSRSNLRF